MIRSLVVAAVLATTMALPASAEFIDQKNGTLHVSGESIVTVDNTAAEVSFGVQVRAPTPAEALNQNSDLLRAVFEAVEKQGVSRSDIQTTNISLQQTMDKNRVVVTGYEMSNYVTIHVVDISNLGDILSAATAAGITNIDRVNMVPHRVAVDEAEMRMRAAADAKAKAENYAEALGLKITGIQSVQESHATPRPMAARSYDSMVASSVPVASGYTKTTFSVNVVYQVEFAQ